MRIRFTHLVGMYIVHFVSSYDISFCFKLPLFFSLCDINIIAVAVAAKSFGSMVVYSCFANRNEIEGKREIKLRVCFYCADERNRPR